MSDEQPQLQNSDGMQPERISRRKFLTYTIASVGGFLVSGTVFPMVRMAIDPMLKHGEESDFVEVCKLDDLSEAPKKFGFDRQLKDAWYDSVQKFEAWITKDKDGNILALSPICKHLGCTVDWEGGGNKNRYFCPCHFGFYYSNGLNVPNTPPPAPLDKYEVKVKGNKVLLGPLQPNNVTEKPKGE